MLNEKQKEVVLHKEGPLMVLAGAGSGKTKALTHRIEHLINSGVPSEEILAITFTNKAAKEMKERVNLLITNNSFISTFHKFCLFILKKEFESVGLKKNFSIYDETESKVVIKSILKKKIEENLYLKNDTSYTVNNVKYFISNIQNKGILSEEERLHFEMNEFYSLYEEYEKELLRSNAVDFNNIINKVLEIFKHEKLRKIYTNQYKYLLIDEYQDTNKAQFQLVDFFSKDHKNICVIGDEDQSIYSFRGADINNILNFEDVFPEAKVIKLEENYRSTQKILECANSVVKNNVYRKGKKLFTNNKEGSPVFINNFFSDHDEADFVIESIQNKIEEGISPKEISIMFRNNSQSRNFEERLRSYNIAYNFSGGMKFFDRKEIKDSISFLKIVSNPSDNYALMRMINVPSRGIGSKAQESLLEYSIKNNCSVIEALDHVKLSKKARNSTEEFKNCITECRNENYLVKIFDKIMEVTNYSELLKNSSDYTDQARYENLQEFRNLLKENDNNMISIEDFLENIVIDNEEDSFSEKINLMTIHASKGLEFDNVYLIGLEDGIFPSRNSLNKDDLVGIEEERRLFYVALTRARKFLSLSYVSSRFIYGRVERMIPSRFLSEINSEVFE